MCVWLLQIPSTIVSNTLPGIAGSASSSVSFVASLPALGYTTYFITNASDDSERAVEPKTVKAVVAPVPYVAAARDNYAEGWRTRK